MKAHVSRHPNTRYVIHYVFEFLAFLALLFVLQAGLVPFDFLEGSAAEEMHQFFGMTLSQFTLPDIVSNLFLYVPIGILFHASLCRHTRHRAAAVGLTILLAAALSGGIEFVQAYSPSRVSSIIDLSSNVAGAAIGAVVSWLARWLLPRLVGAVVREFSLQPRIAMVKIYICVLVVFAALPFSFSFDAARLRRCIESATLIPFGVLAEYEAKEKEALAISDYNQFAFARWASLKCWSRWVAECVSFAVLAWLMHGLLRDIYGFRWRAASALVWWTGGYAAAALSLLQLPILTRGLDVTDILFRLLGLAVGLTALWWHIRDPDDLPFTVRTFRRQRRALVGCLAVVVYMLYTGVIPLVLDVDPGGPTRAVTSDGFLPFFAYFVTRFDLMMDDVMEKLVSFAVFAALLVTAWPRVRALPTTSRLLVTAGVGVALSATIEFTQMFIPVRVTTLSDPMVAACGCALGVFAQEHALRFYGLAASAGAGDRAAARAAGFDPRERSRRLKPAAQVSPTDELIATLMEPHEGAPAEPSPASPPPAERKPRK